MTTTPSTKRQQRGDTAHRLRWNADRSQVVCEAVWSFESRIDPLGRSTWHDGRAWVPPTSLVDLRIGAVLDRALEKGARGGYCGSLAFLVGPAVATVSPWGLGGEGNKGKLPPLDAVAEFIFCDRETGKYLGTGTEKGRNGS